MVTPKNHSNFQAAANPETPSEDPLKTINKFLYNFSFTGCVRMIKRASRNRLARIWNRGYLSGHFPVPLKGNPGEMTERTQKSLWKTVSALTVLIFTFQQIISAAPSEWQYESSSNKAQAVVSLENLPSPNPLVEGEGTRSQGEGTTQDFLNQTLTLIPASEEDPHPTLSLREREDEVLVRGNDDYEYERYTFEEAVDQLRPEYASAVIVKDLSEENLKALGELRFEVAVLVLHGEIVLVTSGSEDEIGVMPAVRDLISKASFISHTHPNEHSVEGPSGQDINEAVGEEYVITHSGVYAYSREGVLNEGNPYSYDWYINQLRSKVDGGRLKEGREYAASNREFEGLANGNGVSRRNLQDGENFSEGRTVWADQSDLPSRRVDPSQYRGGQRKVSQKGIHQFSLYRERFSLRADDASPDSRQTSVSQRRFSETDRYDFSNFSDAERLNSDNPLDFSSSLDPRPSALSAHALARADLNTFIAEQDRYNTASEEERVTLRRGGTLSYTSGLTASSITTLSGSPYPYFTAGSTAPTTLAYSSGQFLLGYSVPSTGNLSGLTFSFDNASTAAVETQSISALANLTFGLKGPNPSVKLEIVDINGVKDTFTLTNISNSLERFWRVPVSSISNTLDKTKIKQINFVVTQANTTAAARTGSLAVRTAGARTGAWLAPVVSSFPAASNQNTVTISGTKEANTGIVINGTEVVARNSSTAWSATVTLGVEGNNNFSVVTKNSLGLLSSAAAVTIKKDTVAPTGSININSGAAYSNSSTVTLNLSMTDSGSGNDKMSFSTDNVNWTTPAEPYSSSRQIGLPAGDGNKTVYVKYYDKAGNVSAVYSKSIILDTAVPTGWMIANGGSLYTNSANLSMSYSAADTGSGIDQIRFSADNGQTWGAWGNYTGSTNLTVPSGDGAKTTQAQVRDKAGNIGILQSTITLDTTPVVGTIKINADAAATNQTQVTLNLTASDALSGVGLMRFTTDTVNWIWSAWENYQSTKSITLPAGDGLKQVFWQIYDRAWNLASGSDSILLDTVPPSASFTINGDAALTNSTFVNLQIYASDSGSGLNVMSYAINSTDPSAFSAWEPVAASKNITLPNYQGPNYVNIKIRDKAGNETFVWKSIVLDTVPPSGTAVMNGGAEFTTSGIVTANLSFTDAISGLSQMRFSKGNTEPWSDWEPYAAQKTFDNWGSDGTRWMNVQVKDVAGNMRTVFDSIVLDSTPPAASIVINGGDASTSSRDAVLTLTGTDALSGVDQMRLSFDSGSTWSSWENFSASKNVTLTDGAGQKQVQFQIRDKAGNLSLIASDSIQYSPVSTGIIFTSANTSAQQDYALTYTSNGVPVTENWKLAPGTNDLLVRANINGTPVYAKHTVTWNQALPSFPQMPVIPALPSDLISVTSETGHILKYSQGVLKSVEKKGGYELFLPELDANGNLTGGVLRYSSGDLVLLQNSKPYYGLSAAGEKSIYDAAGNVQFFQSADGKTSRFAYRTDNSGNAVSLLSFETAVSSLYENGLPAWIIMADGTDIRYDSGFLKTYRDGSGNLFTYSVQTNQTNGTVTGYTDTLVSVTPSGSGSAVPIGNILNALSNYPSVQQTLESKLTLSMEYDAQKQMKKFTSGKNEILDLQNGLPTSLRNSAGQLIGIHAEANGSDLETLSFTQNNLGQTYDDAGKLTSITLSDGTQLGVQNQQLTEISLTDGSVLRGLKWNGSTLVDFVRTRADGGKETYQAQNLIKKEDPNGTVTAYIHFGGADHPDLMTMADGRTYHFIEYQNAQGLTERISELVSMVLEDGSRIEFKNGKPVRYIQQKQILRNPMEIPVLPNGQSYIASVVLENAEMRSLTIDAAATILSGEILFRDGTQYFIQNGELYKQITPDGKIIEISNQDALPVETFAPRPPDWYSNQELAYRDQLINSQLDFFISGVGIDPITGFPMDNYDGLLGTQSTYSQATLVGMWAEILAAIARGHYVTPKMTKYQAYQKLEQILRNLVDVQAQAGWYGMFSFFGIEQQQQPILDINGLPTGQTQTVTVYKRQFKDIGIGDNLNLSVSLASVIGAIAGFNDPATNAMRDNITASAWHILWKQSFGYDKFYDAATGRFRMARVFNNNGTEEFAGYMDRVFNEFRTGLIWLAAQDPKYKTAVENLDVAIRPYETADGRVIDNAVPYDGGAFQMFWPLIHVDETKYPEFDTALKNFMYTQADYIKQKGIPGLLSAGSVPGMSYQGKIGVPGAAETDDKLFTDTGSLYGTASAFLLAPHYTLQLLNNLETSFPGIRSAIGYTDAVKFKEVTHEDPVTHVITVTQEPVFADQYYGVDQASFILSLMGTSRSYFSNFLDWQGMKQNFDQVYGSMVFGLAPVAAENPAAPDFNSNGTPLLYAGASDGLSHALVKRPAFISTVTDPDLGEGKLYDYLTPNGKFHHTEIEFESRVYNLQEYILLPGRGDSARSLTEGLRFDLLNEGASQGAFYTPGQGYANNALSADSELGEIHRLNFDFQNVTKPVGLWAKYSNIDLAHYDYLSIPIKLGGNTPAGVRLKFELKGMGQIYVSPAVTSEWQFVQIPIAKPAGLLNEIAISVQSADGQPLKGEILLGAFSAFKVRTSNNIDWLLTLGKTDTELRNLLKQAAVQQPALGGGVVTAEEILENFTLDHDGKLVNGILHLADGGTQFYQNGMLKKWVFVNGRTVLFEKGLATFALDLARGKLEEARFYYDKSFNGQIRSFILQDNDRKRIYGGDGKLQTMIDSGNTVQFENGVLSTITTPEGVLSRIEFANDGSLLKAHVRMNDGAEFDIDQTAAEQTVVRANGAKIFYRGNQIVAIETAQNGRTDFTYQYNAVAQLLGVNATFNETIMDPVTGLPVVVSRTLTLFDYLKRPERAIEKSEILEQPPISIIPGAGIGGFSVGPIAGGEVTWGRSGNWGFNSQASYQFKYNSTGGVLMGMYVSHPNNPMNLENYDFIQVTLMQDPSMTWNQDLRLVLKSPQLASLYTFQADNAPNQYKTYGFPLDGKLGTEAQVTIELAQREADGVGKTGTIYFSDISYLSIKKLDQPLWQQALSIDQSDLRSIKNESDALISVGKEVAIGKPLTFANLAAYLDLPSWVVYSDQSANVTGQLVSFKRADGAEVFVDQNQSVTKMILPDGTVNEYAPAGVNAAQNVIKGPGSEGAGSQTADYHYGEIRSVTQADGKKYTFSYEFDETGAEISVMKEVTSGEERRFKNGRLIQSAMSGLETKYSYAQGSLAAANLQYKNRVLESTYYFYNAEETLVKDERGTTWYYDVNGNLVKHLTKDGYLYQYSNYTFEPEAGSTLPAGDYKQAAFTAEGLRAVTFTGYEAADGSQLILDSAVDGGNGELNFINGDHGVNLELDGDRKIKSGQIQFKDGLIVEIENYIPVRGRLASGDFFSLTLPAGETYELIQDAVGAYLGTRVKSGDRLYSYDANGRLVKVENSSGETDTFTYTLNASGTATAYQQTHAVQLAFSGVPYPKQVDLVGGSTQKVMDSGTEVISHDGNGFVISVFKEDINQWDSISGTFTSAADRFTLTNFLSEVRPGQAVAMMVSDTAFANAGETILALLEGLGAGTVRTAAAANQTWGFFGNESLQKGQAAERTGSNNFSTLTKTVTNVSIPAGTVPRINNQPLVMGMNAAITAAYDRFLKNYEPIKPSADTYLVTVYDKDENLVFTRRIDGAYSYYEKGKIRETFNADGELLSVHEYICPAGGCLTGADMTLSRIRLVKARADFEKEAAELEQKIEQAKYDALYRLAWQDEAARLRIQEEVDGAMTAISNQVSYLESIRFQEVKQCGRGFLGFGKKCRTFTVETPGVAEAISGLYSQRSDILRTQQEELARLPGNIAAKKLEIENATKDRLTEVAAKREEVMKDILRQEVEPILMDYYRRVLGRDPSTAEITSWVNRSFAAEAVDITALNAELNQSPEHLARLNQKSAIITGVKSFLEQYLAAAPAEKTQMLASLQLSSSEAMNLERADLDGVFAYLDSRSLHFGQSAFGALQEMLKSKGVQVSLESLGTKSILIDILTGVINRFADGELVISLFALSRTAKIYGQDFSSVKYSFEDLKNFYRAACPASSSTCSLRMIAHVSEDHFVTVTRVTDTEVVFFEASRGVQGEEKTVSHEDFLKVWNVGNGEGHLLVDQPQIIEAKRISDAQAQKIRGAFWPLFFFIAAIVLSAASYAVSYISPTLGKILGYAAMAAGIVGIVASVGSVVVNGLKAAYGAIQHQGFFATIKAGLSAVGKFVVQSVQHIGRFILKGFNFLKDGFSSGLAKFGSAIGNLKDLLSAPGRIIIGQTAREYTFTQQAGKFLLAAGVSHSITHGLEGFGLNPTILRLAGAFVSAGVMGVGGAASSFLKSGVQGLLMQGVSEMGLKLNLPPPVTNALSLVTGAALNSWFNINDLTLKQNLTQVLPQVTRQLTLGGAELLGRSLGWSPRLSYLVGLPLAGIIGGITMGIANPYLSVVDGIRLGLRSSITGLIGVGASIGLDMVGAPSAMQYFLPDILGNAIGDTLFSKITDGIIKFGKAIISGGQQIISFGQKVLEQGINFIKQGFAKAANLFSGVFDRKTQEDLMRAGNGNIENGLNQYCSVLSQGIHCAYEAVDINYSINDDKLTYSNGSATGSFDALKMAGSVFGGNVAYAAEIDSNGTIVKQSYKEGLLKGFEVFRNNQKVLEGSALDEHSALSFTGNGDVFSGRITNYVENASITFANGELKGLDNTYFIAPPDYMVGPEFSENDVIRMDVSIQKNLQGKYVANINRSRVINNFDITSQVGKYDIFANANFQTGNPVVDPFLRIANSANNAAGYLFNAAFNAFGIANEFIDNATGTTFEERLLVAQSTPIPLDDLILLGLSSIDRTGKFVKAFQVVNEVVNPLPSRFVRVVPRDVADAFLRGERVNLGVTADVFIAGADDIAGITSSEELARRLTLLDSSGNLRQGPFAVLEFSLPSNEGIAVPVFRNNTGFIQGGQTLGGAKEYVITNRTTEELENVIIRSYE